MCSHFLQLTRKGFLRSLPKKIPTRSCSVFRRSNFAVERNRKHFGQAKNTPFACAPLSELTGWDATGEVADATLNGTFDVESVDATDAVKAIFRALRKDKCNAPPLKETITTKDFVDGFKKWDERTSTSCSGRHLSHYKATLAHDKRPPRDEHGNEIPSEGERIFDVITSVANRAVQASHPLERWRTIVNAMLEKILGYPLIGKLRVMHLCEADANPSLGIIFNERLQRQAENLGAL